jgi:hypothetical protein
LKKHKIRTTYRPYRKINTFLRSAKDHIPLESHGVYEVPCASCNKVYIGQTNRRISTRLEEHRLAVKKGTEVSGLAQHAKKTGHSIDFEATKVLATGHKYDTRIIREAVEIEKRPQNLNIQNEGTRLPNTWKPLLEPYKNTRKYEKQPPKEDTVNKIMVSPVHNRGVGPMTRSRKKLLRGIEVATLGERDETGPTTRNETRQSTEGTSGGRSSS